jgi:predicted outer membrane repeat protein
MLFSLLASLLVACQSDSKDKPEDDAGPDSSTDSDTDSDTDTDTDTDSDTDTDTDTEDLCDEGDTFNPDDCGDVGATSPCVRYLNAAAEDDGDGTSWSSAFNAVQPAIDAARCAALELEETCQVWVAAGTYYVHTGCAEHTIYLRPDVELFGGFDTADTTFEERDWDANETILDGADDPDGENRVHHVVTGSDDAVIDGFTITGGNDDLLAMSVEDYETHGGAGLHNYNASPSVTNCLFTGNYTVNWGAAMRNFASSPVITDCEFIDNIGVDCTGGVSNADSSAPVINGCLFQGNSSDGCGGATEDWNECQTEYVNCTFTDNESNFGGTVEVSDSSSVTFTECTFLANISNGNGGAVKVHESSATFHGCQFEGNTAILGGAIFAEESDVSLIDTVFLANEASIEGGAVNFQLSDSVVLQNCLFTGNSADEYGGAILDNSTGVELRHCTLAHNTSAGGGAVAVGFSTSSTTATNSILWGNTPDQVLDLYGAETQLDYCDVEGGWDGGVGNLDEDPLFADAGAGDYHLQPSSPCINAGDPDAGLPTDLEGNPRDDQPDMGAYEHQP